MNRNRLALAAMALIALVGAGCGKKSEKAVAVVGDKRISAGELLLLYNRITPPNRPPFETLEEKKTFLNIVISKEVLLQAAITGGFDKTPKIVGDLKAFHDQELAKRVHTEMAQKPVTIDAAELEDYYNKTQSLYRVRDIWLVGPKEKADAVVKEVRAGLDFDKAAEKYSENDYKLKGGDMGWNTIASPMLAFFKDSLAVMKPGDIAEPIQVMDGFHVIQLVEQKPADMAEFEAKKITVRTEYRQMKENQLWKKYLGDLRASKNLAPVPDNIQLVRDRFKGVDRGVIPTFSDSERALPLMTYTGGSWTVSDMLDYLNAVGPNFRPDFADPNADIVAWATNRVTSKLVLAAGEEMGLDKTSDFQQPMQRKTEELSLEALHADVVKDVKTTDEEVQTFYDTKRDSLKAPPNAQVRFLYTTTQARADSAAAEIAAGKQFAEAVKRWSEDATSRAKGGLIDSISQGMFGIAEFDETVFALKDGEVTRPLAFNNAFYIFKMEMRHPGRILSFDEAKRDIQAHLQTAAEAKKFDAWLDERRAATKIEIHDDVLNAIIAEESGG